MRLCWLLLLAAAWLHALVRGFAFGSGKSDSGLLHRRLFVAWQAECNAVWKSLRMHELHATLTGWARSKAPRLPQLHLLQSRRKPVLQEHAIRTQPFVSLPVLQAAPSSSSSAASKGGKRAAPKLQNQSSKVVAKKAPRQSESDDVVADPAAMRDWMAEAGIDLQRAEKLYNELKGSDDTVEYDAYLNHKIVQQLMQDGTLNADLVKKFWSRYGGGKQLTPLSHQSFMEMQINLDVEVATRSGGKGRAVFEGLLGDDDPVMDELAERFVEDPYNKQFDPKAYFDADTVEFLTAEFSRLSGGKTALSFDQLKKWDRLQEVCANNSISLDVVRTMWEEATQVSGLGSSDKITLNTFLRWNVRLEGVITMVRPLTPEAAAQIQAQYERAFARLTGNQTLVRFHHRLSCFPPNVDTKLCVSVHV